MKKTLLLFLTFIVVNVGKMSAYCLHNQSKSDTITMYIYPDKKAGYVTRLKASAVIKPGRKSCWNWKDIVRDNRKYAKDRKTLWYWVAFKGGRKVRIPGLEQIMDQVIAMGHFPIGGAVLFSGYDRTGRPKFNVFFGDDPKGMPAWKYRESPWNFTSKPWKTYKR